MPEMQNTTAPQRLKTLAMRMAAAAIFVLICATVGFTLVGSRADTIREAKQKLRIANLTLEQNIVRTLDSLDLALQATQSAFATPGLSAMDPAVRRAILFNGAIGVPGVLGVTVHDATGAPIESSRREVHLANVADRSYFRALAANPGLSMYISEPIVLRATQTWGISAARRLSNPDGSFAGVLSAAIELTYFDDQFSALDLGPDAAITLSTTDGEVIARWPRLPDWPATPRTLGTANGRIKPAPNGFMRMASPFDQVDRFFAYSRFASYPLILTVGMPSKDVFGNWYRRNVLLGAIVLGLTLAGALLTSYALRELQRRIAAESQSVTADLTAKSFLARMEALFAASPDAMLIVHRAPPNGSFVYEAVNPVWESMTGVSAKAAIGKQPKDLLPPALAAAISDCWHRCVESGTVAEISFPSPRANDRRLWEALLVPVRSADGVVRRIVGLARDVTERTRLETELSQTQRLEAVGQLTAGVAHNFNNLLQAIYACMDMLEEDPSLVESSRECVRIASQAAHHGATLVQSLLAFARKQALTPEQVDPKRIIASLALLLNQTLGGRIRLDTRIEPGLKSLKVDSVQLESCLLNLALNARDAMPDGGVLRLHVANVDPATAREAGLPATDHIRFTIADTGFGMSPETIARAFEPFYSTKPVGEGTGLGLSMVHGFALQSGGDVRIDSSTPAGTTISLWLPAITSNEIPTPPRPLPKAIAARTHRVMIVDDNPDVCRTLDLLLQRAGYETKTAANAETALVQLQTDTACHLLITDQSMPGMTGSELIGEIQRRHPNLPCMLISGYDITSSTDQLPANVTLLRKPFAPKDLLIHIQSILTPEPVS